MSSTATAPANPGPSLSSVPSSSRAPALPEPGQVVEVRGSTWAATDVVVQGLSRSPADEATAAPTGLQHEVILQSLDEDRMGDLSWLI
mgnify:FL=1